MREHYTSNSCQSAAMRVVLIACIALTACKSDKPSSSTAGSSTPSGSSLATKPLAERVRDAIVAAMPGATVTIRDPQTIHIKRAAGESEIEMALENLELKCRGGDAVCTEAITSAIANFTQANQKDVDKGIAVDKLVVTIKPKQWFDDTDKMLHEHEKYDENKLAYEPLPGDLVAVLGVDRPNGIQMASMGQLADAKLDSKVAFEHARKNLRAMYSALKISLMEGTPVYTNDEDDNYISATILLPELWKPLAAKVKGDLLVGFPSRNRVFATGSEDPKAVLGLSNIAGVAFQTEDHPITKTIFKWSATGWTVHAVR
jgi:uncharacterized protein YtpQ (UPF0354 family)